MTGLVRFLQTAFTVAELRLFVGSLEGGAELESAVKWGDPMVQVAREVVAALVRRGQLSEPFWQALEKERWSRKAEIEALRRAAEVAGDEAATAPRATAPRGYQPCSPVLVDELTRLLKEREWPPDGDTPGEVQRRQARIHDLVAEHAGDRRYRRLRHCRSKRCRLR